MAMFDYKNYSSKHSAELVELTRKLAVYASVTDVMNLPTNEIFQGLGDHILSNGLYANKIDMQLPDGWREITPKELGLNDSALDFTGYYQIKSPLTGNAQTGPQLKLLGKYDKDGKLLKVCIDFAGTNSPLDIIDYFQLNAGTIAPNLEPLLNALKGLLESNGLTGADALVTGYSLGGGLCNIMARFKEKLCDGFFADADYIAHESPVIYDHPDILNFGYENDVVYKIVSDYDTVGEAIKSGGPLLINPQHDYDNTPDNLILFNDIYASPLWNVNPFSILNIPFGWAAHIDGLFSDATNRIKNSSFYEFTHQDSTVVVSSLSGIKRWNTWVEDKVSITSDHYGKPAFLIGTTHDDLLKGNQGGDYIDAGEGNDKIKVGAGADRVDGGEGNDTLILSGNSDDWDVYRLDDGTIFINAKDGSGLKQIHNVENIAFENEPLSLARPYQVTVDGLVDTRFQVLTHLNQNELYGDQIQGTSGQDQLTGNVVFGQGGNDVLTGIGNALLHGGEGNDSLTSGAGNDDLYGAEGNDTLNANGGQNDLYGGVGDDNFVFTASNSHNVIHDFNAYSGDHDQLTFASGLFADSNALRAASQQVGNDVVIDLGDFDLLITSTSIDTVIDASHFIA